MDPLNQNPTLSGNQIPPPEKHSSPIGPVAGAAIVILLLIAGGLYFWGSQINQMEQNPPPVIPSNDMSLQEDATITTTSDTGSGLPPQSASDDVSSIEADANAMNLDQLNAENNAQINNI